MILILVLTFALAQADEKPECTHEVMTNKCEFFKKNADKQKIELKDGTEFPNPFYDHTKTKENEEGAPKNESNSNFEKLYEENLLNQAALLELLENTSIPMRERMNVVSAVSSLGSSSSYGQVNVMSEDEVLSKIKKVISKRKIKSLEKIVEKAKQINASMNIANNDRARAQNILRERELLDDQFKMAGAKLKKEKRKERLKDLFYSTRTSVIEVIKRGRSLSELSADEKKLVDKVEAVLFLDVDSPEVTEESSCTNGKLNAFLSRSSAMVGLCPAYLYYPDHAVVRVLAHEIGHAIDPCGASLPTWTIDKKKMKPGSYDRDIFAEINKTNRYDLFTDPYMVIGNEGQIKKLIDEEVLTKKADGIPDDRYPFQKEYNCLVQT